MSGQNTVGNRKQTNTQPVVIESTLSSYKSEREREKDIACNRYI